MRFVHQPYIVARHLDKIPYFRDTRAGQKCSRSLARSYPQGPCPILSKPYFMAAAPYIIPSQPYIVLSEPYIVVKTTSQRFELMRICGPKTSIKLRKPNKTPAGHFNFWF